MGCMSGNLRVRMYWSSTNGRGAGDSYPHPTLRAPAALACLSMSVDARSTAGSRCQNACKLSDSSWYFSQFRG